MTSSSSHHRAALCFTLPQGWTLNTAKKKNRRKKRGKPIRHLENIEATQMQSEKTSAVTH